MSPFNSTVQLIQKLGGSWRIAVDYCKLSEVVMPVVAVLNVVRLLEQISIAHGTKYVIMDWHMLSFCSNQ